jgi:hypothetical protein
VTHAAALLDAPDATVYEKMPLFLENRLAGEKDAATVSH